MGGAPDPAAQGARSLELEDVACPLCGSVRRDRTLAVRDHEYESTPRVMFSLRRCADCQLYYLSPRPTLRELPKIYPPDYMDFNTEDAALATGVLQRTLKKLSVRRITNHLQAARYRKLIRLYTDLEARTAPRILDVGCGDGHVLDLLSELVPTAETVGIEVSAAAAAKADKRHRVLTGDFLSTAIDGRFDLIISSHVIEHVADPLNFLRRIEGLLTEGGVAIIDTPNVETPLFRLFGRHWGGIHAPRHWALFSETTFRSLAKRSDLAAVTVLYMPIQAFWVWSLHSLLYERAPGIGDTLFHPVACINKPSLYYTALMAAMELLERGTQLFDRRLGQMRVVLRRAS